jgi:hypothetical protein
MRRNPAGNGSDRKGTALFVARNNKVFQMLARFGKGFPKPVPARCRAGQGEPPQVSPPPAGRPDRRPTAPDAGSPGRVSNPTDRRQNVSGGYPNGGFPYPIGGQMPGSLVPCATTVKPLRLLSRNAKGSLPVPRQIAFRHRASAIAAIATLGIALTSLGASAAPSDTPPHPIVLTGTYSLLNAPPISVGTPVTGSTGIADQAGNTGKDTWFCVPTATSGQLIELFCVFSKQLGQNGEDQIQSSGSYKLDLSNPFAPWQNATVPVTGGTGKFCGISGQSALNHPPGSNTYTWTITYAPLVDCT